MRASTLLALVACAWTQLASASSKARDPLQFIAVVEHPIIHTTGPRRVHAHSSFDLDFDLYNQEQHLRLTLEPNHDVLQPGAYVETINADGSRSRQEIDRKLHKVYRGVARLRRGDAWAHAGWARVTVLRDGINPLFEGAFTIDGNTHHIQLESNYQLTKHAEDPEIEPSEDQRMVIWRDSDVAPKLLHTDLRRRNEELLQDRSCRADSLEFNSSPDHPVYRMLKRDETQWGEMASASLFGKRQIDGQTGGNTAGVNLVSTIGQTDGCPTSRKVALVGVAADCGYVSGFQGNQSQMSQSVINSMNMASVVWENAFNISLGMTALIPMNESCPGASQEATPWNRDCNSGLNIEDRLNLFAAWRGQQQDSNSHWTLLTACNSGAAVGLAWLGQACVQAAQTNGNETVSGANVVARTPSEWQVIAHETGHTFGAVHDCDSQTCGDRQYVSSQQCCQFSSSQCDAGGRFLMNPSTSEQSSGFSPCTIGNICSAIGRNAVNTTCLSDNRNVVTIQGQQCGNGIVEEDEDCDCGGEAGCGDNSCCDPTTCKFRANAQCDDSNEDCCKGCQFASAGSVCRPSTGSCDPQETCSGRSAICPDDITAPDGQSCTLSNVTNVGDLQCASGQCTSRNYQCRTVMSGYITGANDTYACDSQQCSLTCASPAFGPGMCYSLQQNFLDGTPCGGGGHCSNGRCLGSTVGGQIKSWIDDHKGLVIGIACGVGGIILLAIISCIWSSCRRRRRMRRQRLNSPPPNRQPQQGVYEYYGGPSRSAPSSAAAIPPPPPVHSHPVMSQQQRAPYDPNNDPGHGWYADPLQQQELWQRAQQASFTQGWRPAAPNRDSSFQNRDLSLHSSGVVDNFSYPRPESPPLPPPGPPPGASRQRSMSPASRTYNPPTRYS